MTKIEMKINKMSAVYTNETYSKIYLAWNFNKKVWHAINKYDDSIEYFNTLSEIC